jgi:hypothetical protein
LVEEAMAEFKEGDFVVYCGPMRSPGRIIGRVRYEIALPRGARKILVKTTKSLVPKHPFVVPVRWSNGDESWEIIDTLRIASPIDTLATLEDDE